MKRLGSAILTVLIATSYLATPALAVPSDDVIKLNCRSAQSVLSQMEKTDAALRINRGRVYNEVLDLFYAMNARLSSNKKTVPKLATITSDFETTLTDFRDSYNKYDDELNNLTAMKCQDKPKDFYDQLVKVRDRRSELNDIIDQLDKLLADYRREFNDKIGQDIYAK